jgi:hypothetical protein
MKIKNIFLLLLILPASCEMLKDSVSPLIQTGDVTDIDTNGAVFNALITNTRKEEVIESGFVWDTKHGPCVTSSEKNIIRN